MTSTTRLSKCIRKLFDVVGRGRYRVVRGPINWPAYDFSDGPGVSVLFADGDAPRPEGTDHDEGTDLTIVLEILDGIREHDTDAPGEVDDAILDRFRDEVVEFMWRLGRAYYDDATGRVTYSGEGPVGTKVLRGLDWPSARLREAYDHTLRVQGLVVSFDVVY